MSGRERKRENIKSAAQEYNMGDNESTHTHTYVHKKKKKKKIRLAKKETEMLPYDRVVYANCYEQFCLVFDEYYSIHDTRDERD